MFKQKMLSFGIAIAALVLVLAIIAPGASAQTCDGSFTLTIDFQTLLTFNTVPDFGIVLYDGNGSAFAYVSLATGGGLPPLSLSQSYVQLADPAPGSMTGKLYALNAPANSVADIEAGTLIATVSFTELTACTGITITINGDVVLTLDHVEIDADALDEAIAAFFDGRLNDFDSAAPVVMYIIEYLEDEWGLHIYDPDGVLILEVTPEALEAIEDCPEANTLIIENEAFDVSLWRLSSCEYQLMAPTGEPDKWYILTFDAVLPDTLYESWEEFIGG